MIMQFATCLAIGSLLFVCSLRFAFDSYQIRKKELIGFREFLGKSDRLPNFTKQMLNKLKPTISNKNVIIKIKNLLKEENKRTHNMRSFFNQLIILLDILEQLNLLIFLLPVWIVFLLNHKVACFYDSIPLLVSENLLTNQ